MLPADVIEQLESLVAEVEDVACVQIDPVRRRGEHHVGYLAGGNAEVDGSAETALGALVVTDLDEASEPSLEDLGAGLSRGQRIDEEAGRTSGALGGHLSDALVEGERAVFGVQMREDVGRAGHHRQGLSPAAIRVGGPEHGADGQRRPVVGGRRVESEDGLGDHQPDVVLHPVFEAARPPLNRVGLRRAGIDPHASVGHGDREGPHVVGERVERAAAGEVEPGVMPVAGEDSFADGAPVEREPMWGQRLSTAAKRSPRGKTAMACPPPVTIVQPRARTSSTVPALSRRSVVVVIGRLPMD